MWSHAWANLLTALSWFWASSTAPRADTDALAQRWKGYGDATNELMERVTGEFSAVYERLDQYQQDIRELQEAERECQKQRRDDEARYEQDRRERAHRLTELEIDCVRMKKQIDAYERSKKRSRRSADEPNDL